MKTKQGLVCNMCKNQKHVLVPFGTRSYCWGCLQKIHKTIIQKIDPLKLDYASYLEKDMLINIYIFAIENGFDFIFQYPIEESGTACSLQLAAERGGYDFSCKYGYSDEDECVDIDCKYYVYCEYVKYVLDFALIKEKIKIDLELDGYFFHKDKKNYDEMRNQYLERRGWKIVRCPYNETRNKINFIQNLKLKCNMQ